MITQQFHKKHKKVTRTQKGYESERYLLTTY